MARAVNPIIGASSESSDIVAPCKYPPSVVRETIGMASGRIGQSCFSPGGRKYSNEFQKQARSNSGSLLADDTCARAAISLDTIQEEDQLVAELGRARSKRPTCVRKKL